MTRSALTELARDLGRHAGGARPADGRVLGARRRTSATPTCSAARRRARAAADDVEEVLGTDRYRDRVVESTRQAAVDRRQRRAGVRARPPPARARRAAERGLRAGVRAARGRMKVVDEIVDAFGWIQEDRAQRTSHALAADGRVWLFDVVDDPELDARVRELGEPAAVVQLLDRHNRDCAAVAQRLGRPAPRRAAAAAGDAVRAPPGRAAPLVARGRALVAGAAAAARRRRRSARSRSSARASEPAGVHPLLRLWPPRSLRGLAARAPARRARRRGSTITRRRSRARCEPRGGGSRAGCSGCRASCARALALGAASRPGRTSRGGAFRPASRTGGLSGSASGAARERGGAPLGGRVAVERRPLARRPAVRADQRLHRLRRHLLAVLGAGRARDRLVHQRPAEVVHAGARAPPRRPPGRASPTTPGCS